MGNNGGSTQNGSNAATIFQNIIANWKVVDTWFGEVKKLPASVSEFEASYGRFDDTAGVQAFVNALANTRKVADEFGDPVTLRQAIGKDPDVVMSTAAPAGAYANLVWVANQIHNVASTISANLNSLEGLLSPSVGDEQVRAEAVRELFCGASGFSAAAEKSNSEIDSLVVKIGGLASDLQTDMQTFKETNLVNEANKAIGGLGGEIDSLKKQAASAYNAWTGKKLPADITKMPESADEATGFTLPWQRKKHEEAKKKYQDLVQTIQAKNAQLLQKQQFANDLSSGNQDFFIDGQKVNSATMNISNSLKKVWKMFQDTSDRISSMCSLADDKQLSNFQWVAKSIDLSSQIDIWQDVSQASTSFSQQSLVDF